MIADRVAQTLDERAVLHLEAEGLLPPSRDVEAVLGVLRSRLQSAWSGWGYLEANVPRDQRAKFVRAIPMIVDGVVIADADFDRACEQIANARLELESPVVLARQSAFTLDGEAELAVFGPTSDGRFDRAAADQELRSRRSRLARYEQSIKTAETRAATLQRLAIRVEEFFERYPSGWFTEYEQRIAARTGVRTRATPRAPPSSRRRSGRPAVNRPSSRAGSPSSRPSARASTCSVAALRGARGPGRARGSVAARARERSGRDRGSPRRRRARHAPMPSAPTSSPMTPRSAPPPRARKPR